MDNRYEASCGCKVEQCSLCDQCAEHCDCNEEWDGRTCTECHQVRELTDCVEHPTQCTRCHGDEEHEDDELRCASCLAITDYVCGVCGRCRECDNRLTPQDYQAIHGNQQQPGVQTVDAYVCTGCHSTFLGPTCIACGRCGACGHDDTVNHPAVTQGSIQCSKCPTKVSTVKYLSLEGLPLCQPCAMGPQPTPAINATVPFLLGGGFRGLPIFWDLSQPQEPDHRLTKDEDGSLVFDFDPEGGEIGD